MGGWEAGGRSNFYGDFVYTKNCIVLMNQLRDHIVLYCPDLYGEMNMCVWSVLNLIVIQASVCNV